MGGNRPPVGIGNENKHPVGIFPEQTLSTEHPVLQRLALLQQLETGHPPLEQMQFSLNSGFPLRLWMFCPSSN